MFVLVTSRAPLIWSFIAIRTPCPIASSLPARRTAFKRLTGPSALIAVAGRIAPTRTTGFLLFTVKFRKKAVSSKVSVPWVITIPSTSFWPNNWLTLLPNANTISQVKSKLPQLQNCSPETFATFKISGTASIND